MASSPSVSRFRWAIGTLIFVAYTLVAADRANIGITLPYIRKDFVLTNTEAGALISLFFIFYSLGQLPAGLLLSRVSVRKTLPIFMALTSLSTAIMGVSSSALQLKFGRALLGIAEAPLPLAMLATINRWFPPREKGMMTGIMLAAAKFGPVIVPPLGAVIIATSGWRTVFLVFAIPGFLLAMVWAVFIADKPREIASVKQSGPERLGATASSNLSQNDVQRGPRAFPTLDRIIRYRKVTRIISTKGVFKSIDIWGCAIAYLLMTGLVNVLLAWLPTYLTDVKKFTLANVGILAATPFIGGVLGNVLGGLISDKILGGRRKPTMIFSSIATAVMMLLLINAPNSAVAIGVLMGLAGLLLNIGYSSYSVYSMGRVEKEVYPVAMSVINCAGQAGGAIAPFVTGVLLDRYSWTAVFAFLSVCAAASVIALSAIVEPADE